MLKRNPRKENGRIAMVVEKQTEEWIAEFRSSLTKLAEETMAQCEAAGRQLSSQADEVRQLTLERQQRSGAVRMVIRNVKGLQNWN